MSPKKIKFTDFYIVSISVSLKIRKKSFKVWVTTFTVKLKVTLDYRECEVINILLQQNGNGSQQTLNQDVSLSEHNVGWNLKNILPMCIRRGSWREFFVCIKQLNIKIFLNTHQDEVKIIHFKINLVGVFYLLLVLFLIELLGRFAHVRKILAELFITHTFSQINAMIDIALPIPRNINAEHKRM